MMPEKLPKKEKQLINYSIIFIILAVITAAYEIELHDGLSVSFIIFIAWPLNLIEGFLMESKAKSNIPEKIAFVICIIGFIYLVLNVLYRINHGFNQEEEKIFEIVELLLLIAAIGYSIYIILKIRNRNLKQL